MANLQPAERVFIDDPTIAEILESKGIEPRDVPQNGRDFEKFEGRVTVSRLIWKGRRAAMRRDAPVALQAYRQALSVDEDNFAALLDTVQIHATSSRFDKAPSLRRLMNRYPTHPEALHWAAHRIWSSDNPSAEQILMQVLPHFPNNPDILYDLACSRSLAGDLDASADYLLRSQAAGYQVERRVMSDPDLRNLRDSGRLTEILGAVDR